MDLSILEVPGYTGKIGMTSLPGGGRNTFPRLNLDQHLHALKRWGTQILVSLNESWEYGFYGDDRLPRRIPSGIRHIEMPIPNGGVPDAAWEARWQHVGKDIRGILKDGGKVALHCIAGHGRTGTIAAKLLVEFGVAPAKAMELVRSVRPSCIENMQQESYILDLKI